MQRHHHLLTLLAVVMAAACAARSRDGSAPARCVDVAEVRACWGDSAAVWWTPRGLAARRGGPFVCAGATCEQRHPRLPDDGEWECVELAGAAICHGGGPPAGVVVGPADPAWRCSGELPARGRGRVCVDYAPDRPDAARAWTCRYDLRLGVQRVCTVAAGAAAKPVVGAACDPGACPAGAACVTGRCLPRVVTPSCWLDADCGGGDACVLAACVPRG